MNTGMGFPPIDPKSKVISKAVRQTRNSRPSTNNNHSHSNNMIEDEFSHSADLTYNQQQLTMANGFVNQIQNNR